MGLHESFRIDAPTSLNFPSFFEFWPFFDDLERPRSGNASSLNLTIRSSLGLSEVSSFRNISFRFSNDEFRRRNLKKRHEIKIKTKILLLAARRLPSRVFLLRHSIQIMVKWDYGQMGKSSFGPNVASCFSINHCEFL